MLKPKEVVRALKKAGFSECRQEGSHLVLRNASGTRLVVVPMHRGDLKRGLLFGIIKSADLSQDQFLQLL